VFDMSTAILQNTRRRRHSRYNCQWNVAIRLLSLSSVLLPC